jgi:hypothetical protein
MHAHRAFSVLAKDYREGVQRAALLCQAFMAGSTAASMLCVDLAAATSTHTAPYLKLEFTGHTKKRYGPPDIVLISRK